MGKILFIAILIAASLLAGTSAASACCFGYGYYGWYAPTYHSAYGYWPAYYGGYGYSYPSYYSAYGPVYYSYATPAYYYATPTTAVAVTQPANSIRQSFYLAPTDATQTPTTTVRQYPPNDPYTASMVVRLPDANAQVWFDDLLMTQRGAERLFYATSLTPGIKYTYTVRARWTENGRLMDESRLVQVAPDRTVTIDFRNR